MINKTQKYDYDVIVVGSGMSGGHAAMEFTKKGYKVLVLDRGKSIEHGKYETEGLAPWQLPFRDKKSHHMKVRQPLQSKRAAASLLLSIILSMILIILTSRKNRLGGLEVPRWEGNHCCGRVTLIVGTNGISKPTQQMVTVYLGL